MVVVLDTNHHGELVDRTALGASLARRLSEANANGFTTIITIQEVTQGWLAEINRKKPGRDQLHAYAQFYEAVDAFSDISILRFDEDAADTFHRLLPVRPRIGTMDLKSAAICVSHSALLLTRNLVDLEKVPGLRVENWLD